MSLEKKPCDYCKEEFIPTASYNLYCSNLCRSRFNQRRNGHEAKDFKCQHCGTLFKRRSAKNTKCKECRDLLKLGTKLKVNFIDYPKTDREKELQMQEEWIKKNKEVT